MLKKCSGCEEELDVSEFELYPVDKSGKKYQRQECKKCRAAKRRARRAVLSPEKKQAELQHLREYREKNRERRKAYSRAHYAQNKERHRLYKVTQAYGVTPEQFYKMLYDQDGRCAICGEKPSGKYGLCVDHDHDTGKVRALLCGECNSGIGKLKDDSERLRAAAMYIEKWRKNHNDEQAEATRLSPRGQGSEESGGEGTTSTKTTRKRGVQEPAQ